MHDRPQHPQHPQPGPYWHYKGGCYTVLSVARHSETEEWLVVYRADADHSLWVRPLGMWQETVMLDGVVRPRFAAVGGQGPAPESKTETIMRAIGYQLPAPASDPYSLQDIDQPQPVPMGRDLLVAVRAVSVNPVDAKVRLGVRPPDAIWKVLGWDAAGEVVAVGAEASLFRPGDAVFYAGALERAGSNAEFQLVDERIVGAKPATLGWADSATLPLTAVTAWETLFDRLDVQRPVPGAAAALLIVGGAGGVGSIAIQLARALTDLVVIATASRPESREWALSMGAHHVIDHHGDLAAQIEALGLGAPGFVFSTTQSEQHRLAIAALIAPQGRLALIDDPATFDIMPFKRKSVSVHWELMFTRTLYKTPDMGEQGRLLGEVSALVDAGRIRSTLGHHGGRINAASMRAAHALQESGTAIGKTVLEGFGP